MHVLFEWMANVQTDASVILWLLGLVVVLMAFGLAGNSATSQFGPAHYAIGWAGAIIIVLGVLVFFLW